MRMFELIADGKQADLVSHGRRFANALSGGDLFARRRHSALIHARIFGPATKRAGWGLGGMLGIAPTIISGLDSRSPPR